MKLLSINQCKRVLVVDDCQDNLLLMELLLQSEGYEVKSANSGKEGLAAVKQKQPNLIILDLMMPDISGLEVVQRLKKKCHLSNIPIILLTANSNLRHEDVREVDALCYNPFDVNSLLEKVKLLLSLQVAA